METTPTIFAYAPLIIAGVAGVGIFVTMVIFGSKTVFTVGGLFKEVSTLKGNLDKLEAAVEENHKELRADNAKLREELLHEMHNSTERLVDYLTHHGHMDKDGGVTFTRPVH